MSEDHGGGGYGEDSPGAGRRAAPPAPRPSSDHGEDSGLNGSGEDHGAPARSLSSEPVRARNHASRPAGRVPSDGYLDELRKQAEALEAKASLAEEASLLERKRLAQERLDRVELPKKPKP